MSVLMTAGRKAMQARIAAQKLKDQQQQKKKKSLAAAAAATAQSSSLAAGNSAEPPLSTPRTVVWYWQMNGVPTTVMFNKDKNEVWCNGYVLESMETCGDGFEFEGIVNFGIYVEELESIHDGRICRLLGSGDDPVYELYVDGFPIPEHTSPGLSASVNTSALQDEVDGGGILPLDFLTDLPPCYDEAVYGGRHSVAQPYALEPKKTK